MKRALKRLDLTARSFFALIEPGSASPASLLELALAADRSYMLTTTTRTTSVALSPMNSGPLPMSNGLTRLQTRFLDEPGGSRELLDARRPFDAAEADEAGLVTFAPDEIDWDDEVRLAVEERAAFSPDAMTGMEANLRFAGPETMETKIFGRLTAWQNWISSARTPSARTARSSCTASGRPQFDGSEDLSSVDLYIEHQFPHEKIPNNVDLVERQAPAARARAVAAEIHPVVAGHGAAGLPGPRPGLPAHGGQRRPRGLGALRLREDARLPLGHLPRRSGRTIARIGFGDNFGQPVWHEVPGEFRNSCAGSSSPRATPSPRASSSSACSAHRCRASTTSATCSR